MSLVEIGRYPVQVEADLARLRLEAAGLHAIIFDEHTNPWVGWGRTIGVRLMVLDADADEALAILADD